MNLPQSIETQRLILKTPSWQDVPDIFRYASKPEVTHFLSWHAHKSIADSYRFEAKADEVNIGSWRVMEKVGMKRDAYLKNYIYDDRNENPIRNFYLYSICT